MNTCPLCHKDLSEAMQILGRMETVTLHMSAHLQKQITDLKGAARTLIDNHPKLANLEDYRTMVNIETALISLDKIEQKGNAWITALRGRQ